MNLIADLGNTSCKLAFYSGSELQETLRFSSETKFAEVKSALSRMGTPRATIVSSVVADNNDILQGLVRQFQPLLFDHVTPLPITNNYASPETLGKDRLANAVASAAEFGGPVLSVDFGTCVKYDLVDESHSYTGGAISPGLKMRYRALHDQTGKLPLLNKTSIPPLLGKDTSGSIESGVMNGIRLEVQAVIKEYQKKFRNLKVVLTGGDHLHFVEAFKNDIFARPNLTLDGLNRVLVYNEEK